MGGRPSRPVTAVPPVGELEIQTLIKPLDLASFLSAAAHEVKLVTSDPVWFHHDQGIIKELLRNYSRITRIYQHLLKNY